MKQRTYYIITAILILFSIINSCNKRDKLTEDVDDNSAKFIITQPSITQATFVAKCTNYSISVDTIYFLDPNSAIYVQPFGGQTFDSNEEFMIGGYTSVDGTWIIQFKGYIVDNSESFDTSIPFDMIIPGDDDDEEKLY